MHVSSVLGGYDMEEKAARAYDLAALKYWGPSTHINFPVTILACSFSFFYRDACVIIVLASSRTRYQC